MSSVSARRSTLPAVVSGSASSGVLDVSPRDFANEDVVCVKRHAHGAREYLLRQFDLPHMETGVVRVV